MACSGCGTMWHLMAPLIYELVSFGGPGCHSKLRLRHLPGKFDAARCHLIEISEIHDEHDTISLRKDH